jgi:hypothetical protein
VVAVATGVFLALTTIVAVFQVALAAGVPWGHLTWGGRFPGRLPARMRGAALLSAVLLVSFVAIVVARAGFAFSEWQPLSAKLIWVVVAYCAIGVLANAATPSRWERIIWLPVVTLMLACALLVALG